MKKIEVYKSVGGKIKQVEIIYEDEPHTKSLAAAVLLKHQYKLLDDSIIDKHRHIYNRILFSREYLNRILKEKGHLQCTYCGKDNLIIEEHGMLLKDDIKATVDHVIPVSEGINVFDYKIIVVACGVCNRKKGSLSLNEFLKRHPYLKPNYEILNKFLIDKK